MTKAILVEQSVLDCRADALVNTVNCQGFMGKGIALAFARDLRFKSDGTQPSLEEDYEYRCSLPEPSSDKVRVGVPYIYALPQLSLEPPRFIVNFPTKNRYQSGSRIEWVEAGLELLVGLVETYRMSSIAMPALGCGNGGLRWQAVEPLIEAFSRSVDIPVYVALPGSVRRP